MFFTIFLFEIQNGIRRPVLYFYFAIAFFFTVFAFVFGALPASENEHFNSPMLIGYWLTGMSMVMMVVTAAVMGTPLYKDIEYNVKSFYYTYPITKSGYFLGRFFGSFLFVSIIGAASMLGAYMGSILGSALLEKNVVRYGPNHILYYLHPYFFIVLPNLFLTSALFFGLVAIKRNVKVIYSSSILLVLGYLMAVFLISHIHLPFLINLLDPFAFTGIHLQRLFASTEQQNSSVYIFQGALLINRLFWLTLGMLILFFTYLKFNFEAFTNKKTIDATADRANLKSGVLITKAEINFSGSYKIIILLKLIKIELINIIRDNYFRVILISGIIFLFVIFWIGNTNYGVSDFPRTVELIGIFNDNFLFFIFFVIIFYTGETIHRDKLSRFNLINDTFPPPNWVMSGAKLISLLVLAGFLSFLPLVAGVLIQLLKGFYHFNFTIYISLFFLVTLPKFTMMLVLSYAVHVIVNNKFIGHGIGILIWVLLYFLHITDKFNYNLLMYSFTPNFVLSDMDGIGHMTAPIFWFNLYWIFFSGLLVITALLLFPRGVTSSFRDRLRKAPQRFDSKIKKIFFALLVLFLATGSFIYYNVSYLNDYLTDSEIQQRAVAYEKQLKKYQDLPLPKITKIRTFVDLYPYQRQARTHAFLTVVNKTHNPIFKMLFDGTLLSQYNVRINGRSLDYESPLIYPAGKFNFLRARYDTAKFRLYKLKQAMMPGDSTTLEINSYIEYSGFRNALYGTELLHNGTLFNGGLPLIGYDEDKEIKSTDLRRQYHLAKNEDEDTENEDTENKSVLLAGRTADVSASDITVSTSGDQIAVAPGEFEKSWKENGRNYFHYVQNSPYICPPFNILSGRYKILQDTVHISSSKLITVRLYYNPTHSANLSRFINAYKKGLQYYSSTYGNLPVKNISLVETGVYQPKSTLQSTVNTYNENFGWNAEFNNERQLDYCFFFTAEQLAHQWWEFGVMPNNTAGAKVIASGLPKFDSYVMAEKNLGRNNMNIIIENEISAYLYWHNRGRHVGQPLTKPSSSFEWNNKAGAVLYELRDLIGEENMSAALHEFYQDYAFKRNPPYAGSEDLYKYLQKHTPDSIQYYLSDSWNKITFYDNKIVKADVIPLKNKNGYKVSLTAYVDKKYLDKYGREASAKEINDYIDIGVFAEDTRTKTGSTQINPLYLKKLKFKAGEQSITIIVKSRPSWAGIDPFHKLIDRIPNDNIKNL